MAEHVLNHLGDLLEMRNRTIRREAVQVFSTYHLDEPHVEKVLKRHLESLSWDARMSSSEALAAVLHTTIAGRSVPVLPHSSLDSQALLLSLDIPALISTYKPLLSAGSEEFTQRGPSTLRSARAQRSLIDEHLDLSVKATGLSSASFLPDSEIVSSNDESKAPDSPKLPVLKAEVDMLPSDAEPSTSDDAATQRTIVELAISELSKIVDVRWQVRHGAALALGKIFAVAPRWLPSRLCEESALRLLQVLCLDRFNDFVSGRSATAPVREAVAQAIAHIINHLRSGSKVKTEGDDEQEDIKWKDHIYSRILDALLQHIHTLLSMQGEKTCQCLLFQLWVCRQSALLVMKYYFAISEQSPIFESFFDGVVLRLKDDVDDVVSSAVTALSSLFSNASLHGEKKRAFVSRVMDQMWTLLHAEIAKENMRAGLDGLVVDLLDMVETWMKEHEEARLTQQQLRTVLDTIDPMFRSRTQKAIRIISIAATRDNFPVDSEDMYSLLKVFYRVMIFAPPTDTQAMLEELYVTTVRLLETRALREIVMNSEKVRSSIGMWMSCLLVDHKTGVIDVFTYRVDGPTSKSSDAMERMCSEEMRFVSEREKDGILITRKILAAKFVAILIQVLFESGAEINGQKISTALQLLFGPPLQSTSMFQNLGAAILLNEWAAQWKTTLMRCPTQEVPGAAISLADGYVRSTQQRHFDEMTASCAALSTDCSEFVEWCRVRGAVQENLEAGNRGSAEEIAKQAFVSCERACIEDGDEKNRESLIMRYKLLVDSFENAKTNIKANTARVHAFLASALFYFGFLGDKLTPLVRPVVEVMMGEGNETVAAEAFRGSVPLLIGYSASRQPKPYVKVLSRALDAFSSCTQRIPRPGHTNSSTIISLEQLQTGGAKDAAHQSKEPQHAVNGDGDKNGGSKSPPTHESPETSLQEQPNGSASLNHSSAADADHSVPSRNALLLLAVCTTLSVEQVPEFYDNFDLDGADLNEETLLTRLELHRSLWARVGSRLSDTAASRVLSLLCSPHPELRFAGAKAVETFTASCLADTLNRLYDHLAEMVSNLESENKRRGAAEAILRISSLGDVVIPVASLMAPIAFARLADTLPEIRDAAGLAFRSLLPLLAINRDASSRPVGLSDSLWSTCLANRSFVHVLSDPSRLDTITSSSIADLSNEVELRHYQLEGVTWMGYLRRFGLSGILADDMGLGKTLQTLCAIIRANADAKEPRPSLVICPRTLVEHWCAEWAKYFPARRKTVIRAADISPKTLKWAQLVVCGYDDIKSSTKCMGTIWRYVVLDEGHILRNPNTKIFKAVTSLRAESRLVLSGTPVQNSSADLWALFAFLIPGLLGDEKYFRSTFIRPIQQCRSPKATEAHMKDGQEALGKLHRLVLPFVLRRLKQDVLKELPEKVVADYECSLTELQKRIYETIVDRCCSSPTGQRALSPLHALIALRKVVDHPSLVADLVDELQLPMEIRDQLHTEDLMLSGKMQALGELLAECGILRREDEEEEKEDKDSVSSLLESASSRRHRALIFCQWRASVTLVDHALSIGFATDKRKSTPIPHLVLDGNVPTDQRQALVDRFNSDKSIDVLVLTTHIGGVGLNLVGADVVIFLDHDWNPMKDLQAIDRAHRLGQTRSVNVYRLITKGTIEEKVMSYQKFKCNTADALIGAENRSLSSMRTDELLSMFSLEESASTSSSGQSAAKKRKMEKKGGMVASSTGEDGWNLSELWDESQYEESFSISGFLKDARP